MILNKNNKRESMDFFKKALEIGVDFKLGDKISNKTVTEEAKLKILTEFPKAGKKLDDVFDEFSENILPYCTNFSSNNFMGFPDAGNSVASISGAILADFLQQNLINQSFCGPTATFVEIAVIQWLRETVGYTNKKVNNIWDVGGIITPGGTSSNTIAVMLARENKFPNAIEDGISDLDKCWMIVPKGIGHYSVKSGQMWTGCGNRLLEVETENFRYNLKELERTLKEYKGRIMCLVAYAGDSRTMTIDNLDQVADLVKSIDPEIWLHADACHGFSLGFSDKLKYKIMGIEKFDSISTDPHKVLTTPYVISALLVKDPEKFKTITSKSDLIMQEEFAFGQITPFLGSRPWNSLKLWFLFKNFGKEKIGEMIEKRHELALYLEKRISEEKDFVLLNKVQINSVAFMYVGNIGLDNIEVLNSVNKKIHDLMLSEGLFHLHQFSVPDSGVIKKDEVIYPLRYMNGNPNTTENDIENLIKYVRELGERVEKEQINK
ncbi:MAG: pyridoxal-dependent decarboxylase [Candidatus Shapirobacteria bacterium]